MNIPRLKRIPHDLELTQKEFDYLNKIGETIFGLLNQKYCMNLTLDSDQVLCLIILIIRHNNNTFPTDPEDLIPAIKQYNTPAKTRHLN